ncbi:MAG: Fe2+-dependent dioxygenase [Rhodospirillaceae bacterium]|nr:Fe2+-dependent dioxygenase [Rhodospirillaceae bacterium]|tara:strand:+ start:3354 stop:4004 length:651 start_codon:yes stop_codon:yes gene_type:complete
MITCIPELLSPEEAARLRALARNAEFESGTATAGKKIHDIKNNLQMKEGSAGLQEVHQILGAALKANELFQSVALPKVIFPPTLSRYNDGMTYGNHVDAAIMGNMRVDISITIFLNDPESYDGGALMLDSGAGDQEVKLPAGHAVTYPTGVFHRVSPVTRGERLAAVTWIQSAVRSAEQRAVLHDLRTVIDTINDEETTPLLVKTRANLLRMWTDI